MSSKKASPGGGHTKHRNYLSNATYITKLLKHEHEGTGISRGALQAAEGMIRTFQHRIASATNGLLQTTSSRTLTSRDLQAAIRIVLPGELATHAINRGTKAITTFNATASGGLKRSEGGKGKAGQAGLIFPPTRMLNQLMSEISGRTRRSSAAGIYYAAVIEYLVGEILDLATNASKDNKAKRIIPRHLYIAISNDEELNHLFPRRKNVLPHGGVLPNIHQILLPGGTKSKAARAQES